MQKVLLTIGDATEVLDTMYPYFRLQEEGYQVVVAAPERRRYHMVLHERPLDWDITEERPGYHLESDVAFRDIHAGDYVGMVVSGGRAPEYLRYNPDLIHVVRELFAAGKPVASVCHGIEILAAASCLRGRTITTVAKCQLDAELCGATYVDQPVVVSANLVTARTWHDNAPFMREFLKLLRAHRSVPT